jgi:dihydrofolate reductase
MNRWISFVVAFDRNRVIGKEGRLPWHLPDDMGYFRRVTMGKPVIMGRKTYASIGKPLVGRQNIVLTRDPDYKAPGCTVVYSVSEALATAGDAPEVMIAGGAEIYAALLPLANRMYLTLVNTEVREGDAFFPALDPQEWREVSREFHDSNNRHPYSFEWVLLERKLN